MEASTSKQVIEEANLRSPKSKSDKSKTQLKNKKRALRRSRNSKISATPKDGVALKPKPKRIDGERVVVSVDALPWKHVEAPWTGLDFDAEGAAFDIEELEGVEVVYGEEDEKGNRKIQFKIDNKKLGDIAAEEVEQCSDVDEDEWIPLAFQSEEADEASEGSSRESESNGGDEDENEIMKDYSNVLEQQETTHPKATIDRSAFDPSRAPAYAEVSTIDSSLLRSFQRLGFKTPTAIQLETWKVTVEEKGASRDVIGISETGSGKTLAYVTPILQHLLLSKAEGEGKLWTALVLAPTRELAHQIRIHIRDVIRAACVRPSSDEDEVAKWDPILPFNVVALTGGMSIQKQRRLLSHGADIVVATPGRLWDLAEETQSITRSIQAIKFLVLDEADRMIEAGHFAELDSILKLLKRKSVGDEQMYEDDFGMEKDSQAGARDDLRTFIFSATMSKNLQRNLKKRKNAPKSDPGDALGELMNKLDFRDPEPHVIDLSPQGNVATNLQECKVDCLTKEKDSFLYYFLLRYPSRTLVFFSAIDGIRRILPLFQTLGLNVFPLHSGMQQRARLKNLERFRSSTSAVLLATDVAARGLDIPAVEHVIHFQPPRTADAYIHRCGRTARAGSQGLAVVLSAPEERSLLRSILKNVGRDVDLDDLPVEYSILEKLRYRLDLARQIDGAHHRVTKANSDAKWLRETARAMEIELDEDDDVNLSAKSKGKQKASGEVAALKQELKDLLNEPLTVRGVSHKYLTAGAGRAAHLVDDLIMRSNHAHLLGVAKRPAIDDVRSAHKRSKNHA